MQISHYVSLTIASCIVAFGIGGAKALTLNETEATGTATNNTIGTAEEVPNETFTTPVPPTVFLPAGFPDGFATATISGTGGKFSFPPDVDFYSFSTEGGDAMFDIDGTGFPSDTILALFDDTGTLIAFNDDSRPDLGTSSLLDSFVGLINLDPGTYFIVVTRFPNNPSAIFSCFGFRTDLFRPDGQTGGVELANCTLGNSSFPLSDLDGGFPYTLHISLENPVSGELAVVIDIKPGNFPNSINLDSGGVTTVAILGSADFDVSDINPDSLTLATAGVKTVGNTMNYLCSVEDVSGPPPGPGGEDDPSGEWDGFLDLVCKFMTMDLAYEEGETTATIAGELNDGTPIEGADSVNIVP